MPLFSWLSWLYWLSWIASALAVAFAVCLVVIASLLLFVLVMACGGCVVVGGFLSLRMIATKRGHTVLARPLFVGCGLVICSALPLLHLLLTLRKSTQRRKLDAR